MSEKYDFSYSYQPPVPAPAPPPVADPVEPEEPEHGGCRGCLWGLAGAGGCLLVLVLIVAGAALLGIGGVRGIVGDVAGLFTGPREADVISSQTLVTGIQPLGQLVSVGTQLAQADIRVAIEAGALNACGFSASHVAQGAVEAGIDLTRITEDDITFDAARNTYIVNVPAPQLTSCRVDYIRQYERSFTTCSVDWDEARLLASYTSLLNFRDDAVEGGLLSRAEQETRVVLANFIRLVTGSEVEIVFRPASESIVPQSCTPDVPMGWVYDAAEGRWYR